MSDELSFFISNQGDVFEHDSGSSVAQIKYHIHENLIYINDFVGLNSDDLRRTTFHYYRELLTHLEDYAIRKGIFTIRLSRSLKGQRFLMLFNYRDNGFFLEKRFFLFQGDGTLANFLQRIPAENIQIGEENSATILSVVFNCPTTFNILDVPYDSLIFRNCFFYNETNLDFVKKKVIFQASRFNQNLNVKSEQHYEIHFVQCWATTKQEITISGLSEFFRVYESKLGKIDLTNSPKEMYWDSSNIEAIDISDAIYPYPLGFESHLHIQRCKIHDFSNTKHFDFKSILEIKDSSFVTCTLHSNSDSNISITSNLTGSIHRLIVSDPASLIVNGPKIDNLTLFEIKDSSSIKLENIQFQPNGELKIERAKLDNLYIGNINLKQSKLIFKSANFSKASFFKVSWPEINLGDEYKENVEDTLESYRTLKKSYQADGDVLSYLNFYKLELRTIYNFRKHLSLSWSDQIILFANKATHFGLNPLWNIFLLLIWSSFYVLFIYLLNGIKLNLSSIGFWANYFWDFSNAISITSTSQETIYSLSHPGLMFINKAMLGFFYYQIISSFRKFNRK